MDFKLPSIKQNTGSPKHAITSQTCMKLGKVKLPKVNLGNIDNQRNFFHNQNLFDKINADEQLMFEGLVETLENLDTLGNN